MAPAGRRTRSSLIETLFRNPRRFGFFQAVRVLEAAARRKRGSSGAPPPLVGTRADPPSEAVRFVVHQSTTFPTTEIEGLAAGDSAAAPPRMSVSFFGLTGPSGVLPQHYTAAIIRGVRHKSYALRDFLDLFNHRLVSLFVRAASKYRLPLAYETSPEPGSDAISTALRGIVGLATDHVRGRLTVGDQTILHYAGLYGHQPRSASGLVSILSDYFGGPVHIEQFFGRWMALAEPEQTMLPRRDFPLGRHGELGGGATIGARVWEIHGSFRLHVGPLDYGQFQKFMPSGDDLKRLAELVDLYVGPSFVFDVRLTLRREAVPALRLTREDRPSLGWNTWLVTAPPPADVSDAVFTVRAA
jgi:type VI secretion system protein ImpH